MRNPVIECEFCYEVFAPKRTDARFCSRLCQTTSYNRSKAEDEKYLKLILPVIRKNRNVLKSICESQSVESIVVSRGYLREQGYRFGYLTMCGADDNTNSEIHIVGDFSIEKLTDGNYKIEEHDKF
jgi:hypothetical protein